MPRKQTAPPAPKKSPTPLVVSQDTLNTLVETQIIEEGPGFIKQKRALQHLAVVPLFNKTLMHHARGYSGTLGIITSDCLEFALGAFFEARSLEASCWEDDFDRLEVELGKPEADRPSSILKRTGVFQPTKKLRKVIKRFANKVVKHTRDLDEANHSYRSMLGALCRMYGLLRFCEIVRDSKDAVPLVLHKGIESMTGKATLGYPTADGQVN